MADLVPQFRAAPPAAVSSSRTLRSLQIPAVDTGVLGARYIAEQAKRVFEFDPRPRRRRADRAGRRRRRGYVAETVFDVTMDETQLEVDLTQLWDPGRFDVIPGVIGSSVASQWDDFHGTSLAANRPAA